MPIYHNTGEGWRVVERWPYLNENELEQFLLANTQFIGGERDDIWTAAAINMGPHVNAPRVWRTCSGVRGSCKGLGGAGILTHRSDRRDQSTDEPRMRCRARRVEGTRDGYSVCRRRLARRVSANPAPDKARMASIRAGSPLNVRSADSSTTAVFGSAIAEQLPPTSDVGVAGVDARPSPSH